MGKGTFGAIVAAILALCAASGSGPALASGEAQGVGGLSYASVPDEAALYLNDMVFVRDTVTLPAGAVRVLLPPGTYPNTLRLTEGGARVGRYRIVPTAAELYYSQAALRYGALPPGGTAYSVLWEPDPAQQAEHEITLEYVMSGASWTPLYDMQLGDETAVDLAFYAELRNTGLMLDGATVYLVAGQVDLSQQVDQMAALTFNQYAVGYSNETVALPTLGVGGVDVQHVYAAGALTAAPGDLLYLTLAFDTLPARRLHVWNAADQQVDVIYKVQNTTTTPFAEGVVRVFQDGLFVGSDFVETTPPGSEGSITAGGLPDVRVRRAESATYMPGDGDDYYLHEVTLEIHNFGDEALDLVVLDRWEEKAQQFEFSAEPERRPDNLLRWEISVARGETQQITYEYRTEY